MDSIIKNILKTRNTLKSKKSFKEIYKNNKLSFLLYFVLHYMQAQEKMVTDTSFETARNLAFKKNEQAQDRHIITKSLTITTSELSCYHLFWDGDYKKARTEFAYVIDKDLRIQMVAAIKMNLGESHLLL
jgi:hypothetical protein